LRLRESLETVAKITGLSVKEVEKIKEEMKE
jgi:hypothetical protein